MKPEPRVWILMIVAGMFGVVYDHQACFLAGLSCLVAAGINLLLHSLCRIIGQRGSKILWGVECSAIFAAFVLFFMTFSLEGRDWKGIPAICAALVMVALVAASFQRPYEQPAITADQRQ